MHNIEARVPGVLIVMAERDAHDNFVFCSRQLPNFAFIHHDLDEGFGMLAEVLAAEIERRHGVRPNLVKVDQRDLEPMCLPEDVAEDRWQPWMAIPAHLAHAKTRPAAGYADD